MLSKIFLSDKIVITAIVLNAILIFIMAFPDLQHNLSLTYLEFAFTLFFIFEICYKCWHYGTRKYLSDGFNKLDFVIVILSIPSLIVPFVATSKFVPFTVLRLLRLIRLTRLLYFIPNLGQLITGLKRAFKASVFVFLACFLYIFILSIISSQLFYEVAPRYFGDPLISFYTTFQLFTIEGWNDIADAIAKNTSPESYWSNGFSRIYFMFVVLSGGIFGLSIANAVFVDEMTIDNNIVLEEKIDRMQEQLSNMEQSLKNISKQSSEE